MKNRILTLLTIISLLFTGVLGNITYASTEYAYSFGTDYSGFLHSDIDTSQSAKDSAMYLGLCGFSSYYNIKPNDSYMKEDNPDGVRRISSAVVIHRGHANYDHIGYRYHNKSNPYKTGVYYKDDYDSSSSGYVYAGVTDADTDFSNTKLVVYSGCKTASNESTNISKATYDAGAKTVLGWTTSKGTDSSNEWHDRFMNELANGLSVRDAVNYANSFTYDDDRVKNTKIYGNEDLIISDSAKSFSTELSINEDMIKSVATENSLASDEYVDSFIERYNELYEERQKYREIVLPATYIKSSIEDSTINHETIANLLGFKKGEYSYKISNNNGNDYIIDISEVINGCITNNSYTVFVKDNAISKIFDNRAIKNDRFAVKEVPKLSKTTIKKALSEAADSIPSEAMLVSQEGELFYDLIINTISYKIITDYALDDNSLGSIVYFYNVD